MKLSSSFLVTSSLNTRVSIFSDRLAVTDLLGNNSLVGRDIHRVGRDTLAESEALEGGRGLSSHSVSETLDGGGLGLVDTVELVGLGGVDRGSHGLTGLDDLEVVGCQAGLLVVDVQTLEREHLSIYLQR